MTIQPLSPAQIPMYAPICAQGSGMARVLLPVLTPTFLSSHSLSCAFTTGVSGASGVSVLKEPSSDFLRLPSVLGGVEGAKALLSHPLKKGTLADALKILGGDDWEIRLLTHDDDIRRGMRLRHKIFLEHHSDEVDLALKGAHAQEDELDGALERDRFDDVALHMVVTPKNNPKVFLGYVRLILEEEAVRIGGFYSSGEFNLSGIMGINWRIMELGRLLVRGDKSARFRIAWMLLRSVMLLSSLTGRRVLLGCGSFFGTNIEQHRLALSWLIHHYTIDMDNSPTPLPSHRVNFDPLPKEDVESIPMGQVHLPSTLGLYLSNGALVSNGIAIDKDFDTFDVLVIMSLGNLRRSLSFYVPQVADLLPPLDVLGAPELRLIKDRRQQ